MPFQLRPLAESNPSPAARTRHPPQDSLTDSDSDAEPNQALSSSARSRSSFLSPLPSKSTAPSDFLLPPSLPTTAPNSPLPSRSSSPLPQLRSFSSSTSSSAYGSDTDEPSSPLLRYRNRSTRYWSDDRRSWWPFTTTRRRRRKREGRQLAYIFRSLAAITRLPYFPMQPTTIVLSLLLFSVFALLVTLLLIHILNPDKEPLPWREYCSIPPPPSTPPFLLPTPPKFVLNPAMPPLPDFPPPDFDSHPPVGIYLGVFSTDQAIERRMLIRSTWAKHPRSRNGAGAGDGGEATSRTIVRFILGRPRPKWERRIQLEMQTYNDIVILPIVENMNYGKTHAFFTWSASNAWVPPLPLTQPQYPISYSNMTAMPPRLAIHDPRTPESTRPWIRPDFVIKSDDDSFVMLSELEARLRVEMVDAIYATTSRGSRSPIPDVTLASDSNVANPQADPLIYWGYLVKNRFMAGELYGLSWSIVNWVAVDSTVKGMTKGAEDKQVAKWMSKHPRANSIRWASEHCWIYDHPRSGTVYSHGYLFPSEISRVRRAYESFVQSLAYNSVEATSSASSEADLSPATPGLLPDSYATIYKKLSHSTVSSFGSPYSPPAPNLTPLQSVEALVEGSAMSLLRDNVALGGADAAWKQREGRLHRYTNKRIGGTVVVHFVKRNEWFLETAVALLEGDDVVEGDRRGTTLDPRAIQKPADIS